MKLSKKPKDRTYYMFYRGNINKAVAFIGLGEFEAGIGFKVVTLNVKSLDGGRGIEDIGYLRKTNPILSQNVDYFYELSDEEIAHYILPCII